MTRQWVVLLEAVDEEGAPMSHELFDRLVAELQEFRPRLMHRGDRYALHLDVSACSAVDAHTTAVSRWRNALQAAGAPRWPVVRVEVLTAEEFEADCQRGGDEQALDPWAVGRPGPSAVGDELLRDVFTDRATALPTAELFRAKVEHLMARPQPAGIHHAVLMLHVASPASIGRALPEETADLVLVEVVNRLTTVTRRADTVAKLGVDTLGVLVPGIEKGHAVAMAERALAATSGSVPVAGGCVPMAGFVGIALTHAGYDDPDRLFAAAAFAMESAKRRRGGRRWQISRSWAANPHDVSVHTDEPNAEGTAGEG